METKNLAKEKWISYFDQLSIMIDGRRASVEIDAPEIGSQIEANNLPLLGITYDPKDNLIEVAMEGLDHMINKPVEVNVAFGKKGVEVIEIINADGHHQIVKLSKPVMLLVPD